VIGVIAETVRNWRHGADQHQLDNAALGLAVAGDIARCLTAAGRVADMDRVPQVEVLDHRGGVSDVVPMSEAAKEIVSLCLPQKRSFTSG
jgi:hypothetical protein